MHTKWLGGIPSLATITKSCIAEKFWTGSYLSFRADKVPQD